MGVALMNLVTWHWIEDEGQTAASDKGQGAWAHKKIEANRFNDVPQQVLSHWL